MNTFAVLDDRWIPYCNSPAPNVPADISLSLLLPVLLCGILGFALLITFVRRAMGHKHFTTVEEFKEANERIIAHIVRLETPEGEDLHWLCRSISRDLLRVTSFVASDVAGSACRYASPRVQNDRRKIAVMALVRENVILRLSAIQIEIFSHIRPLRASMVKQTNRSVDIFSTKWLKLLEQYCFENLRHEQS